MTDKERHMQSCYQCSVLRMYRCLYVLLVLPVISALNDRPVIGILTQENEGELSERFPGGHSYIAASYVKYLEGSGARVMPVWINQSSAYYNSVVDYLNGLLIPGGSAPFNNTGGYYDAGTQLYNLAIRKNDDGVYFPIWGTSSGFQLLAVLSANDTDLGTVCDVQNVALPLHFTQDFQNSSVFGKDIFGIAEVLQRQNATINFHDLCITEQAFSAAGMLHEWHVLAMSEHGDSGQFISMMEHRKYPFYGVQFHPEKNIFEWGEDQNTPHFPEAILVSQYLANFFVNEARRNHNYLPEENQFLMYRYNATHTGGQYSHFEQVYFFQEDDTMSLPTTTTTTTTTTSTTTTTTTSTSTTTIPSAAVASTTTRRTQTSQEAIRSEASQLSVTQFTATLLLSALLLIVQNSFVSASLD